MLVCMRTPLTVAFFVAGLAYTIHAQAPQVFEAATVRPSGPNTAWRFTADRSQLVARAHTLTMLIATSYPDLPLWRVSGGPPWATRDLWDIVAKLPPGTPGDQPQLDRKTEQLLRALLTGQFRIQTHFEYREQPVYELVVARGGPKLKPSDGAQFSYRDTLTGMELRHIAMAEFSALLYSPNSHRETANRFVVDRTDLAGYYDFPLNWAPSNVLSDTANQQASIYTAIQEQLGLKLQPGKGTVAFLVIDHAETPPAN